MVGIAHPRMPGAHSMPGAQNVPGMPNVMVFHGGSLPHNMPGAGAQHPQQQPFPVPHYTFVPHNSFVPAAPTMAPQGHQPQTHQPHGNMPHGPNGPGPGPNFFVPPNAGGPRNGHQPQNHPPGNPGPNNPGPNNPGNHQPPEAMVDQAMRFDRNHDGQLDRNELLELARQMHGPQPVGEGPNMRHPSGPGANNHGPVGQMHPTHRPGNMPQNPGQPNAYRPEGPNNSGVQRESREPRNTIEQRSPGMQRDSVERPREVGRSPQPRSESVPPRSREGERDGDKPRGT